MASQPMKNLPSSVDRYLEALNRHDVDQMIACFAPDALVHDIGEDLEMRGRGAIQKWLKEVHEKYRIQARPLKTTVTEGRAELLTEVSGNFEGSPLRFLYAFDVDVKDDLIRSLSTTFVEED